MGQGAGPGPAASPPPRCGATSGKRSRGARIASRDGGRGGVAHRRCGTRTAGPRDPDFPWTRARAPTRAAGPGPAAAARRGPGRRPPRADAGGRPARRSPPANFSRLRA